MTLYKNNIKCFFRIIQILVFPVLFSSFLAAVNTQNAKGSNTVYALSSEENYTSAGTVWGFVTYQEGFSINSTVTLSISVASNIKGGRILISDGGELELLGDLCLDSDVYLEIGSSSGDIGYVDGNGNGIICDGDLDIPANRKLRFVGDTIIDCREHYLNLGSGAQLLIDSSVTLTLRNLVLTGLQGVGSSSGSIGFVDNSGSLALQNVVVEMEGDYSLDQGYLYIHDDVLFEGIDKKFTYSSRYEYPNQRPIRVDSYAKLLFDFETIFEYGNQSSVSDECRHSLILTDTSSVLVFNGSKLIVPVDANVYSGFFVKDGTLILDNLVTFSNYQGSFINKDENKGIIFGDVQDGGVGPNLNLKVLADARVEVLGSLVFDA